MALMAPPKVISGKLKFQWKQYDGTIRDLSRDTSPTVFIPAGSAGLGTPDFQITDDKLPIDPGSFLHQINTEPRKLQIPIVVSKQSFMALIAALEDIHDWIDTGDEIQNRPGTLIVTRPDDTVRYLKMYYLSGLNGDLHEGGPTTVQYVMTMYAPDPYPTDPADTVLNYTVAQADSFAVINQGRKEAYPIWKITGPFVGVDIINTSTAKLIRATNVNLTAGQYLIVDTRPAQQRPYVSVYDQANINRFPVIANTPLSDFWSMIPGQNNMNVRFTGGATSATTVQLTYLARYRSLLR